ncbi:hypothetical protein AB4089_22160 [Arthrobacter sp. 2MCAF15]|uniref:hypothetical protein n=1 Tax=Arthrobacter sp. 2MCAF15 TaxID=3232984 RepID=UPI003F8E5A8D
MADSQYDQFLQEATTLDDQSDSVLGQDCLYGLYTSWCFLSQTAPRPEDAFWAAMKEKKIRPGHAHLRMKGPAAADYIVSSYPGLV